MIKTILGLLLLSLSSVVAAGNTGTVCFGKNYAKPYSEHTERVYIRINNSKKLYFNTLHSGAVLRGLDTNIDHIVSVYFDEKLSESWTLNFLARNTQSVVIYRNAAGWRTASVDNSTCQ